MKSVFWKKLICAIRHVKIAPRMIALFLIASLLPILLGSFLLYGQASETMSKNIDKTVSSMNTQSAGYLSEKICKVISDSKEIVYSDIIQHVLTNFDSRLVNVLSLSQAQQDFQRQMGKNSIYHDFVTEITAYLPDFCKIDLYTPNKYRFKPIQENLVQISDACNQSPGTALFFPLMRATASFSAARCRIKLTLPFSAIC